MKRPTIFQIFLLIFSASFVLAFYFFSQNGRFEIINNNNNLDYNLLLDTRTGNVYKASGNGSGDYHWEIHSNLKH